MRHKTFILVAVVLLVLVGGAVAAYAYDSSRDDVIAEGVTVAGVDVGGMDVDQARVVVARRLEGPLEQPIAVVRGKKRFTLSAADAGVQADVAGMVDAARQRSRSGSIFTRVARDISGGEESADVPARVSYDRAAVRKLVRRVGKGLNREARDAEVSFPSLDKVKEQKGRAVKTAVLRRRLAQALTVPGVDRQVRAPVRVLRPKVTQAELAAKYPRLLVADRANFQLRFYKNLQLVKSYPVAVGAVGFDTPAGLYHIQNKAVDPAWTVPNSAWAGSLAGTVVPGGSAENPLKARWLGIFDGAGIHGTDQTYSLGSAASHGCIRMSIPDVIELYDQVPVGAPIYIA
jgi:lipoprotein-anchoring transpeptidase ErfK/SrfK